MNVVFGQVRPHMELSFENLLAHINTVYILVTKEKKMSDQDDKTVPSLATWRHQEDGTEIIQEASLRLKVKTNKHNNIRLKRRPVRIHIFFCFLFFSIIKNEMQGEMIHVQENGLMLFLGSPSVLNLEDLTR